MLSLSKDTLALEKRNCILCRPKWDKLSTLIQATSRSHSMDIKPIILACTTTVTFSHSMQEDRIHGIINFMWWKTLTLKEISWKRTIEVSEIEDMLPWTTILSTSKRALRLIQHKLSLEGIRTCITSMRTEKKWLHLHIPLLLPTKSKLTLLKTANSPMLSKSKRKINAQKSKRRSTTAENRQAALAHLLREIACREKVRAATSKSSLHQIHPLARLQAAHGHQFPRKTRRKPKRRRKLYSRNRERDLPTWTIWALLNNRNCLKAWDLTASQFCFS